VTQASETRARQLHPAAAPLPSVALVSTFPPTACGLATFASALAKGLKEVGVERIGVVRSTSESALPWDELMLSALKPGSPKSVVLAARCLDEFDCVLMQHEFGIYGGDNGEEVLDLLSLTTSPVITTLHTVPLNPSEKQRHVLESVVQMSSGVVTMTDTARERLASLYDVDEEKVTVIPHGAAFLPPPLRTETEYFDLLTWGLLGPGKGIEWVIDALGLLSRSHPHVRYTVAGTTHPKVFTRDGDAYRNSLMQRARDNGVSAQVLFDSKYRSVPDLISLAHRASLVVLPYDSIDQITSGVLVDAIAAGKPVIATEFPHAIELVGRGCGVVVPHADPRAIANAISHVVDHPENLREMEERTLEIGIEHDWKAVAASYCHLGGQLSAMARAS
jgi:glycosyltransferase involved in cell wall biosynthesis